VKSASPPAEGKAGSGLLERRNHGKGLTAPPPRGRDQLEDIVGDELARRLVGALAGDHAIPARRFD
jgi:hypothetical protein